MIAPNDSSEEEFKRVLEVSQLDLDYQSLQELFENLTNMASKITGANLCLVNILDSYWQWSIAATGMGTAVMRREQSVCQYTIGQDGFFEVDNFRDDDRFDVPLDEKYCYYLGLPLKSSEGNAIGALCVIDEVKQEISKDQRYMLKLIGAEIIEKLEGLKKMTEINRRFHDMHSAQRELGYELRGPVSSILGLSKLAEGEDDPSMLKQYFSLAGQSSSELIDIIGNTLEKNSSDFLHYEKGSITLTSLKDKLIALYSGLGDTKHIKLNIELLAGNQNLKFSKQSIIQVAGNLISNAIKFSSDHSTIKVVLGLKNTSILDMAKFSIQVQANGACLSKESIEDIMSSNMKAKESLVGVDAYGLGLKLARYLVLSMGGQIEITSERETKSTQFDISIPRFI
ncbi:GAF domain-containing sensor histidine kinase [Zunongwangia sp. HRR-M8]|uniref:GAF domain-containing sensor histidine kinase n=1 Tax=Zunongwangia sp. HRR-M8 TaxID=3015170 RepID=UPI0022DD7DF0|nr:HAMP domain-containing sensor histidine kinase [Zunongwangia sp. HRR-M8]WBL22798.1 HAMP domain-containing sensor histidine kinase [Zunongwangia sp. HRR-M8]